MSSEEEAAAAAATELKGAVVVIAEPNGAALAIAKGAAVAIVEPKGAATKIRPVSSALGCCCLCLRPVRQLPPDHNAGALPAALLGYA
jgi:hypothetical protein